MLRNVRDLLSYSIRATDGAIGTVDDFYFDDEHWTIRYLIVDTGRWLASRKVLLSPIAIGTADWMNGVLPVSLTKAQVEGSPGVDAKKPLSRQREAEYCGYYGYPHYWDGTSGSARGADPESVLWSEEDLKAQQTHLSSTSDSCPQKYASRTPPRPTPISMRPPLRLSSMLISSMRRTG